MAMFSSNSICFEGICRVFRNAVVRHIRKVLRANYPDEWEGKISAPFRKEWEEIRRSAETRRITGELDGGLTDDADLLGVNHFYNLFELYFDDLFPETRRVSESERRQKKQALLGWARNYQEILEIRY